jgi:hypothetical protein
MADDLYHKSAEGWNGGKEERDDQTHTCKNADVSSRLSANLYIKEIICEENANINVDHSAKLTVDRLVCKSGTLNVSYSSTLIIVKIDCPGTLDIQESYSSTIWLHSSGVSGPQARIGATTGVVRYSSTAIKFPNCTIGKDTVQTEHASTWEKR